MHKEECFFACLLLCRVTASGYLLVICMIAAKGLVVELEYSFGMIQHPNFFGLLVHSECTVGGVLLIASHRR